MRPVWRGRRPPRARAPSVSRRPCCGPLVATPHSHPIHVYNTVYNTLTVYTTVYTSGIHLPGCIIHLYTGRATRDPRSQCADPSGACGGYSALFMRACASGGARQIARDRRTRQQPMRQRPMRQRPCDSAHATAVHATTPMRLRSMQQGTRKRNPCPAPPADARANARRPIPAPLTPL